MRTIEEIRQDIKKSDDSVGIVRGYEYLNLFMELAQAQDAEIARLQAQLEWQPIETAPKDGTVIEVVFKRFKRPILCYWRFWDERQLHWEGKKPWAGWYSFENKCIYSSEDATHWRSIPPLPQAKEGSPMDNPLTDEGSHE